MTTDVQRLVGRLRDGDDLSSRIEAADELERQSAEIEQLREHISNLMQAGDEICKAGRDLRGMVEGGWGILFTTRSERLVDAEQMMGRAMGPLRGPLVPPNK